MEPPFIQRFDTREQYQNLRSEILQAVDEVLASGRLIFGPRVAAFEQAIVEFLGGTGHAVGVGNGTDALAIALRALSIGSGDEVITVANTAVGTVSAIRMAGAIPVFCDIEPRTLQMDPADVERRITRRTRALIPVHLHGNACDLGAILQIAGRHGLRIVEDCAQAFGTNYAGRPAGSWGDVGCFSFYPTKNLAACGDGGLCFTQDSRLAESMRELRMYGCDLAGSAQRDGVNSRLDEIQAAILTIKLRSAGAEMQARGRIAAMYSQGLSKLCRIVATTPETDHSRCLFVVRVGNRARVIEHMKQAGIECAVHYPTPIHHMPAYRAARYDSALPRTDEAALEILSLPCFPQLSDASVRRVIYMLNRLLDS